MREDLLQTIASMGFTRPTPIQVLAIPPLLRGEDVVGMAETGSGKTIAFAGPLLQKVEPTRVAVQALVLCPTRELAQQVATETERLAAGTGVGIQLLVGGEMVGEQMIEMKSSKAQVIVGTPGRVLDLCKRRFISIEWAEYVILDEGDEMLDMGFIDDVTAILERTPDFRQTGLFSATFPEPLKHLALRFMRDPLEVRTEEAGGTVQTIEQYVAELREEELTDAVACILQADPNHTYLVFCERKLDVDRMYDRLLRRRIPVACIHGDYKQEQRFKVMQAFRDGQVRALVATDIASRGLDISHISHVVNVGVPQEPERYVHRVGRTGRAGRTGVAITLVPPRDRRRWQAVLRHTGDRVQEIEFDGQRLRGLFDSQEPRRRSGNGRCPSRRSKAGDPSRPRGRQGGSSSGRRRSRESGQGRARRSG